MKTQLALAVLLGIVSSRANAFCKSDGYQLYATGYAYCYSSNWYDQNGDNIDPFAANKGDSNAAWDSNWIYAPPYNQTNPNPTLLLFLAGHGENIDNYTEFLRTAQALGYYVIGLAYQNGQSLQSLCGSFSSCYDELLSQNVYYGTNNHFYTKLAASPYNYGTSDNSINNRLGDILTTLQNAHIAGNFPWKQFYDYPSHQVNWNKIIVAGHSEGGATAAWITKNKPVIAGLTFEAPYSMLNARLGADHMTPDGTPTAPTPDYTPYPGTQSVPPASNTAPVPYLQCAPPSNCTWATKLHITLNKYDTGYDNIIDTINYLQSTGTPLCDANIVCDSNGHCHCLMYNWAGVNMQAAAASLKPGQEKTMDASHVPTAATLAGNTWYTVTELPTLCVGHHATVEDNCHPPWIPSYWNVLLASVLPPQH